MYWVFSISFHIGVWLLEFPIDAFCDISILFVRYWGPMEATFLTWIMSNGLSCGYKLRASNLKHKVSCFHHPQTLFVEGGLVRQLFLLFFFLWLTNSVFLHVLSLFRIVLYRNLADWFFICCHFSVILILFVCFWGPMDATFSSWIPWFGLLAVHNLENTRLKRKFSCFHIRQTLFVGGSIVRQLCFFYSSFDKHVFPFWFIKNQWIYKKQFYKKPWIWSNGLSFSHKLRASKLK